MSKNIIITSLLCIPFYLLSMDHKRPDEIQSLAISCPKEKCDFTALGLNKSIVKREAFSHLAYECKVSPFCGHSFEESETPLEDMLRPLTYEEHTKHNTIICATTSLLKRTTHAYKPGIKRLKPYAECVSKKEKIDCIRCPFDSKCTVSFNSQAKKLAEWRAIIKKTMLQHYYSIHATPEEKKPLTDFIATALNSTLGEDSKSALREFPCPDKTCSRTLTIKKKCASAALKSITSHLWGSSEEHPCAIQDLITHHINYFL